MSVVLRIFKVKCTTARCKVQTASTCINVRDNKCILQFFFHVFFFLNVLRFFFTLSFKENAREYLIVASKNSRLPLINRGASECQRPGRLDETSLSSSRFYSRSSQRERVCKYNKRFPRAASKTEFFCPAAPWMTSARLPRRKLLLSWNKLSARARKRTRSNLEVTNLRL